MSIYVSLLTAGTNSHQETSENANAFGTDFVSQGVIGAITNTSGVAPSTGAFAVNAQSTPNMTVAVSAGVAYVTGTPASQNSQTLRVRNSASANVTISANSSGSTKYDWVYIKLDATKAANPAVAGDDVATLVTSRSSSSSSDNGTPPTYGYCVAVVTVANGASSITNANIADKRVLAASVQAGAVTETGLAPGSVTKTKLASGSKVMTMLGYNKNTGATLTASYVDFATVTATSNGAKVHIEVGVKATNANSGGNYTWDLNVLCDGTSVDSITGTSILNNQSGLNSFVFEHTPTAASHTWKIQLKASTAAAVVASYNYIRIVEVE